MRVDMNTRYKMGFKDGILLASIIYSLIVLIYFSYRGCQKEAGLLIIPEEKKEVKIKPYTDDEIANAIYRTEGSEKAKVPYGILSIKVKDKKHAREICLRTIRNQRKRHKEHNCGLSYLECLSRRYCPDTPGGWLMSVKYFLRANKRK